MSHRSTNHPHWRVRAGTAALVAALMSSAGTAATAHAQATCNAGAGNCPATYDIKGQQIQRVGSTLKLQARISQAKMPVGEAVFNSIFVNIKESATSQPLCSATYSKVRVMDSVLNLDLGANFDCSLDDLIARSGDLLIQVCIENKTNCLKPIEMSTVPYAVKATYARQAQDAVRSEVAAQCNYAHRVTADRTVFSTGVNSTGYFDYYTPAAATQVAGLPDLKGTEGVMQWAPVSPSAAGSKIVYIVGQDASSGALMSLDALYLGASELKLASGAKITGANASFADDVSFANGKTARFQGVVDMSGAQSVLLPPSVASSVSYTDGASFASSSRTVGGTGSALTGGVVTVAESTTSGSTTNKYSLLVDSDEYQATLNGAASPLTVQRLGGDFVIGTNRVRVSGTPINGGGGYLVVGDPAASNFGMDQDEIQARTGTSPSTLMINRAGGDVGVGKGVRVSYSGINGTSSVTGGYVVVGDAASSNLAVDPDEIQSRSNGAPAGLMVNWAGGDVTVGHADTSVRLSSQPLTSGSGGFFVAGNPNSANLAIDQDEVQARNGSSSPTALTLNRAGGDVIVGNNSVRFSAQAVQPNGVGGFIIAGPSSGNNVAIDPQQIQARIGPTASPLYLNNLGGDVNAVTQGGSFNIGDPSYSGARASIGHNSTMSSATLTLYETEQEFARLAFQNTSGSNVFHIAGSPNSSGSSAWLNFYSSTFGNIMSLRGDGYTYMNGYVYMSQFATGGTQALCTGSSSGGGYIARCSSSRRYKDNIKDIALGLKTVMAMRPVSFTLKATGEHDIGFIAEEMAKIDPVMTTNNEKGQVESVRYQQLTAILAKAVQEQQGQIEGQRSLLDSQKSAIAAQQTLLAAQHSELEGQKAQLGSQRSALAAQQSLLAAQRSELDELKGLVCALQPNAAACQKKKAPGAKSH